MDHIHLPSIALQRPRTAASRNWPMHGLRVCHRNRSDSRFLPFCGCIHSFGGTCAEGDTLARSPWSSGRDKRKGKERDCGSQIVSFLCSAPAFPSVSTRPSPCCLFLFLLALPSRCLLVRPPSLVPHSSPLCEMIRSSKNDMISPRLSPVARNQIWREFLEKERMHGGLRTEFSISPETARQSQRCKWTAASMSPHCAAC
jgi:hypothetical protein